MAHDSAGTRVQRFLGDTFGVRGSRNVTSWLVAGAAAYYLIYLPEQQKAQEILAQREAAKRLAIERGLQDIDRARPIADPQDTGLVQGVGAARSQAAACLASLPQDLLGPLIENLTEDRDLLALAATAQRFHLAATADGLWRRQFAARFGEPSRLQVAAARLAGGWLALTKEKVLATADAGAWRKPCDAELQAALRELVAGGGGNDAAAAPAAPAASGGCSAGGSVASAGSAGSAALNDAAAAAAEASEEGDAAPAEEEVDELAVVFLVDGSGSVGDEDFACMTAFLRTAAGAVAAAPRSKAAVLQFSNDSRTEVPLAAADAPGFEEGVAAMARMNGGTNIAAAVSKAGALLATAPSVGAATRRVLVLLTDGRIDTYQAKEAGAMVARLADEQANVALWCFGVGRGVDAGELRRIIAAAGAGGHGDAAAAERYVELCVRDDAPW
ncbi:COL14A1 [Scenedesmus sp. PABB004]|nr:COL14A1 [Scenedesmus sp. PABB004]